MKHLIIAALLTGGVSVFAADQTTANATTAKTTTTTAAAPKTDDLKLIHVNDLEQMLKTQKANTFVFDANTDKTREKDGLIPGATPLKGIGDYDTASVLPKDKKANVVFYCANTMCMASHEAAKHARAAGYTNVAVMSDGIEGWKKSGKTTDKFVKQ